MHQRCAQGTVHPDLTAIKAFRASTPGRDFVTLRGMGRNLLVHEALDGFFCPRRVPRCVSDPLWRRFIPGAEINRRRRCPCSDAKPRSLSLNARTSRETYREFCRYALFDEGLRVNGEGCLELLVPGEGGSSIKNRLLCR